MADKAFMAFEPVAREVAVNKSPLIDQDFKSRLQKLAKHPLSNRHIVAGGIIGAALLAAVSVIPFNASAKRVAPATATEAQPPDLIVANSDNDPNSIVAAIPAPISDEPPQAAPPAAEPKKPNWQTVQVRSGDNLASLFSRVAVSPQQMYAILDLGPTTKRLKHLYPGDVLRVEVDEQHQLQRLQLEFDDIHILEVARENDRFTAQTLEIPLEPRRGFASGVIDSSLFAAAQSAGLSDRLTMELAAIFGWDIDFALDIREGDSFAVLYEEQYKDGEKIRDGDILAAEFTNQGRTFKAIRFDNGSGRPDYYTPEGNAMRKSFLRTPVEFTRISSTFSTGRFHPVLNRIRAHKGVDYAAPTGTPIKSTGDGKIVFRGVQGGYGNVVIVQHGSQYTTVYAHLSKYARGSNSGSRVRQGQVIGYVGQSGLATGPHLHYEFRVNGAHRNPLTVKFPAAEPLASQYLQAFNQTAENLLGQLSDHRQGKLAMSGANPLANSP